MNNNVEKNNRLMSLTYSSDEVKSLEKKAKKLIDSLTNSFVLEANEFLFEMQKLLQEASVVEKKERSFILKNRFFSLAHDLKGQGTTYGYDMITLLSEHICDFIRSKSVFSQKEIDLFVLDVEDMKKVLSQPPHGLSSRLKKEIINRLEKQKCLK